MITIERARTTTTCITYYTEYELYSVTFRVNNAGEINKIKIVLNGNVINYEGNKKKSLKLLDTSTEHGWILSKFIRNGEKRSSGQCVIELR